MSALWSRKRRTFRCSTIVALYRSLAAQKCCDTYGHKTKKTSWPNTDYRSYFIYHWTCYFYCKERVGLNWGGLLSLGIWHAHAVKFDELLKVRQTLTELQTALFNLLRCVKACKFELLAEPQTEQPWYTPRLARIVHPEIRHIWVRRTTVSVQNCTYGNTAYLDTPYNRIRTWKFLSVSISVWPYMGFGRSYIYAVCTV